MAHYLVTGGAGFIGSHLVDALLARGQRVRVVDSLVTGRRSNLAGAAAAEFVAGDLADAGVVRAAMDGVEYVLHQAALPSVARSVLDPVESHRANVDATLSVLAAAREAGVRRVVFAGSSSVYGDTAVVPKHEAMAPAPKSPYALQKLIGEQYMRLFSQLYGLETVTLRYFNVFGPRQDPSSPYSGVISLFMTALLDERAPVIHGDGHQTRDFTYVANVVAAALAACEAGGVAGGVFNVATGVRTSLNDLLETLCRLANVRVTPQYAEPRAGDVRHSQADISLARQALGYSPRVPFDEGLRLTFDWYRTHYTPQPPSS